MPSLKPRKPQPSAAEQPAPSEGRVEEQSMSVGQETAGKNGTAPGAEPETQVEEEMQFRTNPEVEKKIADYKEAHPREAEYFTKLVQQHPERAVNFHLLQKQRQHEIDTKAAMRQLPQAETIYAKMTPDSQERVKTRLESVNPYNHTKRFVAAVFGELNRKSMAENRRMMTAPITKVDLAAAKVGSGALAPGAEPPQSGAAPARMSTG
ncbi:MAG: hypothetical protein Q8N18_05045 [Opitutaceae bacterium]|nr:hypothetical protein [Opitutaceae bacterium]